jgi:hypothetical protein
MARKKVLITVTTYPLPSRSYDELVYTAGILEDGNWIRIYPVPLSFLFDLCKIVPNAIYSLTKKKLNYLYYCMNDCKPITELGKSIF